MPALHRLSMFLSPRSFPELRAFSYSRLLEKFPR